MSRARRSWTRAGVASLTFGENERSTLGCSGGLNGVALRANGGGRPRKVGKGGSEKFAGCVERS